MSRLLVFGLGYAASYIAARAVELGWEVTGTSRDGRAGTIAFADAGPALARATHILSSVPPEGEDDPVLTSFGGALAGRWLGYLSSTGVYGDSAGAWVDESAPINGRRAARNRADAAWLALGARVFRLPGIYGPGRSAIERLAGGGGHRIDLPHQVFSRVHVDDIARGVIAGFYAPAGAYNLADDAPSGQNEVMEFAARLMGQAPPPFVPLESLSSMARAFYAENRRVANGKAKRVLGWAPLYPDYRFGLRALSATTSPAMTSNAPLIASGVQR